MLLENIDLKRLKKQTVFVCSERHDGPIKVSLFVLNIIYIHLISRYLRVKYGILVDLIQARLDDGQIEAEINVA